jgi:hypothetical protein
MTGMEITFTQKVAGAVDALNNPTYTTQEVVVDDCLVAPITEPSTAREQQAMEQSKDQVRVHMPKASTANVGGSSFVYDGKTFLLDSSSVKFMLENTPTRWDRYFRAESVNA